MSPATTRWRRGLFAPEIAHLPDPRDQRRSSITATLCNRYARRGEPAPADALRCPDCMQRDDQGAGDTSRGSTPVAGGS